MADIEGLKAIWDQNFEKFGFAPDPFYFQELVLRYQEPHRHYHNLDHIESVIKRIYQLAINNGLNDNHLFHAVLGAFYHDAVYVPGWGENEAFSEQMAVDRLKAIGLEDLPVTYIAHAIRETKGHAYRGQARSVQLLLDADLYELSTNYDENKDKIRWEFGLPSEEDWIEGRSKFLKAYLALDKLYKLPGQEHQEGRARRNMLQESLDILLQESLDILNAEA